MHQKSTTTKNFYVHLIDRSRHCDCDCRAVRHQHSLVDLHGKGHQEYQGSVSTPRPLSRDSFSENTYAQSLFTPTSPTILTSPTSVFSTEKEILYTEDLSTSNRSNPKLLPHYSSLLPKSSAEDQPVQCDIIPGLQRSSSARSFSRDCRKLFRKVKQKMHVQTLFPGRLGRGRKAIVNCPTETAELDSSLMCEMPVPRVAELESPIEIRQPDHGSQTGYVYDHTMTNLNALGSWSEIPELPADFAITPATSHDQFELSPMTAKDRLDYPGFCLGGANDFPTSVIPDAFELFSPLSEELIQECSGGTRLRNPGFTQLAAVPESAGAEEHSYPQPSYQTSFGQKPKQRSPRLPNLTLQTAGIQGKFLSPQSSRRPSIPGNVCATTPSQYSSATTSSRTHSSWSWTPASSTSWPSNPSSGLPSSNQNFCFTNATWSAGYSVPRDAHNALFSPDVARHPTTATISTPLFGELPSYASFFSAHSTAKPYPSPTNNNKNNNNNEDLFYFDPSPSVPTTSSSPAFPIIQHPPHPSAPPPPNSQPPQPQPQPSQPSPHQPRPHTPPTEPQPPPAAAAKDVCERCGLHFKSNPRDLARNKRRHLEISCRFREREAERIACSSPGCGKTFARDCARRIHERNKHGMEMVVGTGRRGRVVRRVRSVG